MTTFKTISGPISHAQLAMAGFGTPDPRRRNAYALTSATYNVSYKLREAKKLVLDDAFTEESQRHRFARQVYSCSEPVPVDTLSFDMLRRASASADGNGFFGPYNARSAKHHDGAAHQYANEAAHAVLALEGLNIIPEDLVSAAMMGLCAQERLKPSQAPEKLQALGAEALARVIARVVLNSAENTKDVQANLGRVLRRAKSLVDKTLASTDPIANSEARSDLE